MSSTNCAKWLNFDWHWCVLWSILSIYRVYRWQCIDIWKSFCGCKRRVLWYGKLRTMHKFTIRWITRQDSNVDCKLSLGKAFTVNASIDCIILQNHGQCNTRNKISSLENSYTVIVFGEYSLSIWQNLNIQSRVDEIKVEIWVGNVGVILILEIALMQYCFLKHIWVKLFEKSCFELE